MSATHAEAVGKLSDGLVHLTKAKAFLDRADEGFGQEYSASVATARSAVNDGILAAAQAMIDCLGNEAAEQELAGAQMSLLPPSTHEEATAEVAAETKKKRGRPRKEKPPDTGGVVSFGLRRDPATGGATFACRLFTAAEGEEPTITGLSKPIEPRELPAMNPESLPSLSYDATPELLGWAAGQLKAIEEEG